MSQALVIMSARTEFLDFIIKPLALKRSETEQVPSKAALRNNDILKRREFCSQFNQNTDTFNYLIDLL